MLLRHLNPPQPDRPSGQTLALCGKRAILLCSAFAAHLKWIIPASLLILVFSCKKTMTPGQKGLYADPQSLFSLINTNLSLTHCDTALLMTGLDTVLADKGAFTVFAVSDENYPTDGTILTGTVTYPTEGNFYGQSLGAGSYNFTWTTNYYYWFIQQGPSAYFKRLAAYHILPQKLSITDMPFGMNKPYATLAGDSVFISKYMDPNGTDTIVTVNGIRVTRHDYQASNGTYHILNQLLFPDPNTSTWAILSGSNSLGYAFEPLALTNNANPTYCNCAIKDTDGFSVPAYNYGTFATALVRTGLNRLLEGPDAYTVLAVPNNYFYNPYVSGYQTMSEQQVLTMNLDTLTKIMQLHILPGRYFLSDFQSYPFNGTALDTVQSPSNGAVTYSKPLTFPTIGPDSVYVIPNGLTINGRTPGFWIFGQGNLLYSNYLSQLNNQFAQLGEVSWLVNGDNYPLNDKNLLPQDVVAPNGVVQFLYNTELVPR